MTKTKSSGEPEPDSLPDTTAEALAAGLSAEVYAAGMEQYQQSDMVQAAMNNAGYRAPDTKPKLVPSEIESTPGDTEE